MFWSGGGKTPKYRNHIIIPFKSHKIDQLQLASIVNDKSVCTLIPDKVKYLYPPKVYYKLNNPNCLRFCNYNKFLNKVTMEEVSNIIQNNCSCDLMPDFIYQPYGHILTGNLDIIKNPELKELFSYGAKHRLPKSISWQATEKEILESLNQHVVSISKRFHLSTSDFSEWKSRIMTLVKHRIFRLNKNYQGRVTFNYNNKAIEITLNELQKIFVIAPVDKASNNFSSICKKFYLKVLLEELGFDLSSLNPIGNITYKPENISESEILNKHLKDLLAMFQIKCTDKDIRLPKLFWIPKLHKNPYKFRFIAGARHCTTKTLSINVNRGLKVVRDNFHIHCESIKKNTGYRYFWSVASTQEFLNNISNVNVHSMQVYDFSTLYTNLEHNDIRNNIFSILDLVFNSSNRKYLCVGYDRSFFAKSQYKNFSCFNVDSFKKAIDYVISEVYVTFAGKVFKQVRGVPMGGNSSPLLADLFLLNCEFSYMKQIVKDKKFGLAKLLSNTSRYIDDVSVVNYKHFDSLLSKIYPKNLIAERNGINDRDVAYLDVKIQSNSDGLRTSVYHKVDDFNFPVVLMTFPNSAIPYNMGINVFAGQVLRYCRICSHISDLICKINKTLSIMLSRGYCRLKLKTCVERILTKHSNALLKFGFFSARQLTCQCCF